MSQKVMSSLAEKFLSHQQSELTRRTYRQDVVGFLVMFDWMDLAVIEFLEVEAGKGTGLQLEHIEKPRMFGNHRGCRP